MCMKQNVCQKENKEKKSENKELLITKFNSTGRCSGPGWCMASKNGAWAHDEGPRLLCFCLSSEQRSV